jgi:hypothetical protein
VRAIQFNEGESKVIRYRLPTLFLCACAGLLLAGLFGARVQAQSLGLTPALIEAKVKRGATYTAAFILTNNTSTRLRFHASTGDYWYDENNARVTGLPGTLPRSASLWVQFSPAEFDVEANSSATVKAIITVPAAAQGSYYTSPIFEGEPTGEPAAPQNSGTITASVAIRFRGLLLLTTEDAADYNVEVVNGSAVPPTAAAPLELQLGVRNRGTAHARMRGIFAILNTSGSLAGRGRFDEKSFLPGQRGTLKAQWTGELAPGQYRAVVTLTYDRVGLDPATLLYELPFEVK